MAGSSTGSNVRGGRLDAVEAALCYLMSRYASRPCYWIAQAIIDHLELLTDEGPAAISPVKRDIYRRLLPTWRAIASGAPARNQLPKVTPFFALRWPQWRH